MSKKSTSISNKCLRTNLYGNKSKKKEGIKRKTQEDAQKSGIRKERKGRKNNDDELSQSIEENSEIAIGLTACQEC